MLPCEDIHKLIEEHLAGTLEGQRRREVVSHLRACPQCHQAVEAARLANMVLREVNNPAPPPSLASDIKNAIHLRLQYRQRPLHERALGSPAFMATCASLLCGAIICLIAIMRVGTAGSIEQPPARVVIQAPAQRVTLPPERPTRPLERTLRPTRLRAAHREAPVSSVRPGTASRTLRKAPSLTSVAKFSHARGAVMSAAAPLSLPGSSMVSVLPDSRLRPATQRISMPESAIEPLRPDAVVDLHGHMDDVRLMDLTAPQPVVRAEYILH